MKRRKKADGKQSGAVRRKATAPERRNAPKVARSKKSPAGEETEVARLSRERDEALEQQAATSDILRVISQSSTDVQPVFEAIVLTAVRLTGCDLAFFLRCDGATYSPMARATPEGLQTDARPPQPIDPDVNFPSRAIIEKKKLYLPDWSLVDLPAYERWVRETFGIVSSLYLPLVCAGESIGLLVLAGKRTNIFGDREIALAETFRDQALIAIQNARLFSETQEALERQTATADILKVIASSPSDVQPVFASVVQTARRLLSREVAAILLCDESATTFTAVAITGRDGLVPILNPDPIKIDPNANFPSRAIVSKKIQHLPDWSAIDLPDEERKIQELYGLNSALYLPMLRGGECIGVLSSRRKAAWRVQRDRHRSGGVFRDQAVIAIENARLFNETREALERQTATADILKVIASSPDDVQPVFEAIAERSKRLVDARSTTVFRLEDGVMHLKAFTPTNPEADATLKAGFPAPLANFSWSEAIVRGDIYRVLDTEQEIESLRELARLRGFRSMLFVPLLRDGAPIGQIPVTRVEPGPFVEHHVQLLQTFADQAVIAIENTRLFNETKEALERQTATADILKVIASSPSDVRPVFEAIAARSNRLVGGLSSAVYAIVEDVMHLMAFTRTSPEADAAIQVSFPRPLTEAPWADRVRNGEIVEIPDAEIEWADHPALLKMVRLRGFRCQLSSRCCETERRSD